MSIYDLPTSVEINGKEWEIESDYRAVLDICIALSDPDLSDQERGMVILEIFYPDLDEMNPRDYEEAVQECMRFINLGKDEDASTQKQPKLVDWEQDFKLMVAPINNVAGKEIRALDYLHWWTFISYYNEINGDSTFAQVVQIRNKLARGQKLEKDDREFYQRNRAMVDFKNKYSASDEAVIDEWI